MKIRKLGIFSTLTLATALLSGCPAPGETEISTYFTYEDISFVDKIGTKTNDEVYDYDAIKVNPTEVDLRDDFAFGVDASMVNVCESKSGVYYNEEGKEQDIFQILKKAGVNFVRFRLWNDPKNKFGQYYGGGNNDFASDLKMAKRAKEANLNVMIDFHYSDFWADPEYQNVPRGWAANDTSEIPTLMHDFTKDVLQEFLNNDVKIDAIQVGNETNNGLCGYKINWNDQESSFNVISEMMQKAIEGAKEVLPDVRTVIHLANGGNTEEFKNYFTQLDKRNVKYDIIGASYYPHLSGDLSELQKTFDTVSALTNKPVMVMETSWGNSEEYIYDATGNQYTKEDEDVGGYLTSVQAQVTAVRDIANVLAKVPNNKGLGIFYWEPAWLPCAVDTGTVDDDGNPIYKSESPWATKAGQSYQYYGDNLHMNEFKDGNATWCNQGLFSLGGRALPSLNVFKYLRDGHHSATEKHLSARFDNIEVTLNLAAEETLPTTAKVVTDFDAIRDANVVWDATAVEEVKTKGVHDGLHGVIDGKYDITCKANCIENFIIDPGFENQGESDTIKDPWKIDTQNPINEKIAKIDRKKDIRSGKSDMNWYYSSGEFSFTLSQELTLKPATYQLTTYLRVVSLNDYKHTELTIFMNVEGQDPVELDCCNSDYIKGWSAGYQTATLPNVTITSEAKVKVGIRVKAAAGAWGHNDDWELVTVE